jgi:iron complex transport system ATP-binding protein
MAGGGTGEMMMRALADAHIPFIAGALNIGDSDHTLALRLASEVITEQPYAPISQPVQEHVRASLAEVKLLIICAMPIGPGNLALLQEAVAAGQRGLPVLLLHTTGMANRDYTGGEGQQLLDALVHAGAKTVASVGEAMDIVKQL